jgi:CRP/FNR family transcriptional regulator
MTPRLAELKTAPLAAALRSCALFGGLPPAELDHIAGFARLLDLAKGTYLFRESEPSHGFYIVRTGTVSVHRVAVDGREQVINIFRPGDSLAEATLAGNGGYPADARAEENATVVLIPKNEFVALLATRPDLSMRMLAAMSQHLRTLVAALDDLASKDVETRLAHWLIKRCPRPLTTASVDIQLDVTKTVLAAELRTRNETLSRALAKLRELGLVSSAGRTIHVLSPLRLDTLLRANLGDST